MTSVAIVGAGVNGVCTALALAKEGCEVTVYDRGIPFDETSSKSSKLLHGGIRYLEHGHIKLVKHALADRAEWLQYAPRMTHTKRFYIPIYAGSSRGKVKLYAGAKIYELLAGAYSLGNSLYHDAYETVLQNPLIKTDGLIGSVSYLDVQMDDLEISRLLIQDAESIGVKFISNQKILKIDKNGGAHIEGQGWLKYDYLINAAGPWAFDLVSRSGIESEYKLNYLKGSHIVVKLFTQNPLVFQVEKDRRIVFVLPQGHNCIVGTTEVEVDIEERPICTSSEVEYLLNVVNSFLKKKIKETDVIDSYSGIRPIVFKRANNKSLSSASRDCQIEKIGSLVNIYGGKWTSAMRLGRRVSMMVD